jgi:2-oxoglutarate ferredoxin oxidoreductase subunit alpha
MRDTVLCDSVGSLRGSVAMDEARYNRIKKALKDEYYFVQGDVACAYGAILAGCTFFAGYPITPATETAEAMAVLMPKVGGTFVQMEDEIASIAAVIGAAWAGVRAMTTTSGPGYSLMQENIGYACMTETPCVITNVQRSGPSTGQPTEPSQGDVMQTRYGSHGDYEIIALAPNSVQECVDLTIQAFNLADRFRNPVVVLTDGEVGHMREKIEIPQYSELDFVEVKAPDGDPDEFLPFKALDDTLVPPMAVFGSGFRTYVTGLTHKESGLPTTDDAAAHTRLVTRLVEKISSQRETLTMVESQFLDDADVAIASYGIASRVALNAVRELRKEGIKAGYFRWIGLWPFPEKPVRELGERVSRIIVPEMNLGQIVHKVREHVPDSCSVKGLPSIGGRIHHPDDIIQAVMEKEKS